MAPTNRSMGSHTTWRWHLHEPMNPALWSTLPEELLQLVFARLPWREILELRLLSKQWKQSLSSRNSEFRRVCTEANPRLFAMISPAYEFGVMSIRMYDIKADTWHHLIDRVAGDDEGTWTMFAGDGGLVCVVAVPIDKKKRPLVITVCNPLTRQYVKLPTHDLCSARPRMVQLVMDRDRASYKVIVVGKKKRGAVAQVFSSETRSWSSAAVSADLIFGHRYDWHIEEDDEFLFETYLGPCAYDCAKAQLLELEGPSNPWKEASVKSFALVKDRLFVLHEERYSKGSTRGRARGAVLSERVEQRYCISEYQYEKRKASWVKLKAHRCKGFEEPPHSVLYTMHLKACNGFLLVFADNGETNAFRHELTWLYDLSTSTWQDMPLIPLDEEVYPLDAMFELQWDAVP